MGEPGEPLASYLGRQLARIREERGLRQQDIAAKFADLGIPWTRNTVATFEIGRRTVTLEEALLLCAAYDVPLAQVMKKEPETWIQVGPLRLTAHTVGSTLAGGTAQELLSTPALRSTLKFVPVVSPTEAERRAARRLKVSVARVVTASEELWHGRRLEAERDRRVEKAGAGEDPATLRALRGHVTRQLLDELGESLQRKQKK